MISISHIGRGTPPLRTSAKMGDESREGQQAKNLAARKAALGASMRTKLLRTTAGFELVEEKKGRRIPTGLSTHDWMKIHGIDV